MSENDNVLKHDSDGGVMELRRIENNKAIYVCVNCGYMKFKEITDDDKMLISLKRSDLLSRVEKNIVDFSSATFSSWNRLKKDILEFRANFQPAREDIGLKIAILACLTQGFKRLDDTTYQECKPIFKITEKVYKQYRKDPSLISQDVHDTFVFDDYYAKRKMYIDCLIEFLSQKAVVKAIVPIIKIILLGK